MYIQGKLKKHLLKVAGALPFCKQSLILFSLLLILFSIFQLIHELDKNVYIVNPERFKLCGMSKSAGLLVLGLFLVGIQGKYSSCFQYFFFIILLMCFLFVLVILLGSWMGARPPRVLCTTSGHLECAALIRVEDHYPMVYGYPVLLGLIICALSGNFPSLHCGSTTFIVF